MSKRAPEHISIVSELDTVIALADAQPTCVIGNEPVSQRQGHEPCTSSAVWAFRGHDGMADHPTGTCPSIVLVCEPHLQQIRDWVELYLAHTQRKAGVLHCFSCHSTLRHVDDVIWGVERIRS